MRSPAPSRASRGFTLIEVMVALVVFAIGVLSLAMLIPLGTKGISKAGANTKASEMASAAVEQLLATNYDDTSLDPGAHSDSNNPHDGHYFVSWQVDSGQPLTLCKRITVTVRWPLSTSTNSVRLVGVKPRSDF